MSYPPPPPGDPLPPPGAFPPPGPPTGAFPPSGAFPPPGPPTGAFPPPGPPPRRSNAPLIAVILAVAALLCAGTAVAGTLLVRRITHTATEAVNGLPTALPGLPTEVPAVPTKLPTDLPGLPTDLPTDLPGLPGLPTSLPTGLPNLPGLPTDDDAPTVTIGYEVVGDGPVDITYLATLGEAPKTVHHPKLPWRLRTTMKGASLASVVAVRTDDGPGTIHCRTTIDGKQVAQSTHDGAYAVVTCSKLFLK